MYKQQQFIQACKSGDIKTVKTLIIHPDVDPTGYVHHTIGVATCNGHKEVVELLMQDPRVDLSDGDNGAIRDAAYFGYKEVVELLLTDKRVMDDIEYALEWCKKWRGYELLKTCVDERERVLERQEKERRVQEAIEEMSADCELYF